MRARRRCEVALEERNAVSKLRPAGPPPTHATSYISGDAAVANLRNRSFNDLAHEEHIYGLKALGALPTTILSGFSRRCRSTWKFKVELQP